MQKNIDVNIYYDISAFTSLIYNSSLLDIISEGNPHTGESRTIIAVIFCVIFIVGLPLNLICTTAMFLRILQCPCPQRRLTLSILCLSLINTVYLITVPILVANFLSQFWTFGLPMCKLYSGLSSPIMAMSSALLLILINDLYLAICRPDYYKLFKRGHHTVGLILAATAYAVTTVTPIMIYADIIVIGGEVNDKMSTLVVFCQTCVITMPLRGRQWYGMYTFVTSFLLPTTVEMLLLGLMILHGLHLRQMRENTSPKAANITFAAVGLLGLIFVCWSPFWIVTLSKEFGVIRGTPLSLHFAVETLPYCCAALSPLFYKRLIRSTLESDGRVTSDTRLLRNLQFNDETSV